MKLSKTIVVAILLLLVILSYVGVGDTESGTPKTQQLLSPDPNSVMWIGALVLAVFLIVALWFAFRAPIQKGPPID